MYSPRWAWTCLLALTLTLAGGTPRVAAADAPTPADDAAPAPAAAPDATTAADIDLDVFMADIEARAKAFKELILRAKLDPVYVLEGLPRDTDMPDFDLRREFARTTVKKLHGYYFYSPVKELLRADRTALLNILLEPKRFQAATTAKLCGGFHPDYALVLTIDKQKYAYMVCFGCDEVMLCNVETGDYYMAEPKGNTMTLLYPLFFAHRRFRPLDTLPRRP